MLKHLGNIPNMYEKSPPLLLILSNFSTKQLSGSERVPILHFTFFFFKIYSLSKYLLSTHYMLGIVLDSRTEWSANQGQSLSYPLVSMLVMSYLGHLTKIKKK